MPKKVTPTRTLNPLQFEALEPHRFEDLVRRLLYAFRDWVDIEPTGRAGSDDGFDIRAWERDEAIANEDEGEEGELLGPGRLWQVQGKREKSITPAQIKKIVEHDIDEANPPYGYILAAAANISKRGYDVLREATRAKGVQEVYFWGKDYLEDQLSRRENDEILFTFFGISLSPRRRSRLAELKFAINNKNKLLRKIFDTADRVDQHPTHRGPFCIRDVAAEEYPYKKDGEKRPHWGEFDVQGVWSSGVLFKVREYYAWVDTDKKEWDYSPRVDITGRAHNLDEVNQRRLDDEGYYAEHHWRHLPRRQQAKLIVYGLVRFADILLIDDKGDPEFPYPHIVVEWSEHGGLFDRTFANIVYDQSSHGMYEFEKEFARRELFPKEFSAPAAGRIVKAADLKVLEGQNWAWTQTLYAFDEQLQELAENDIIEFISKERNYEDTKQLQVTRIDNTTVGRYIEAHSPGFARESLEKWAGRSLMDSDKMRIIELYPVLVGYKGRIVFRSSDY